ncbi:MAG: hypothetical protein WKF77_08920 [Planctomycetaceae bacterium]
MTFPSSNSPTRRFVRSAIVVGLICQAWTVVASAADSVQHAMFAGSLIQPGDEEGDILRRFEVQLLSTNQTYFFHVIDDARMDVRGPTVLAALDPQSQRIPSSRIWSTITTDMRI